jgi:hypothetical protein
MSWNQPWFGPWFGDWFGLSGTPPIVHTTVKLSATLQVETVVSALIGPEVSISAELEE